MTVTVQQLKEQMNRLPDDAQILVTGADGESFSVTQIVGDGALYITVSDEDGEDEESA